MCGSKFQIGAHEKDLRELFITFLSIKKKIRPQYKRRVTGPNLPYRSSGPSAAGSQLQPQYINPMIDENLVSNNY